MSLREQIQKEGYTILKNVFTKEELETCKSEILNYTKNNNTMKNAGGISIPDFINNNQFPHTKFLKDNNKIHDALTDIFNGAGQIKWSLC